MKEGAGKTVRPGPCPGTLGTFGGVFTPSILTILGIILFLRLGYVVGEAGVKRALLIIASANIISVLTTFSLAAIATNLKVKGGGDYYLISRTLGVQFGGAIGIVLYLAQTVSIAFYCIGFGEAVSAMLPDADAFPPHAVAALAAALLLVFAWLGADWATRVQYLIMAALGLALVSFFAGGIAHFEASTFSRNWSAPPGESAFWIVFAIFFPAVTGFTQGVSMSGDLGDPGRSLPLGTFMAVGLSLAVYLASALLFAGGLPAGELRTDGGAMKRLARIDWLIDVGVIAATLSSAMASFLGAPRILQSLARDRVFPILNVFAKGNGPSDNPRRGVVCSAAIAFAVIGLGELNLIAPVVSMFFLISYGLLNYATFFEARTGSPSFRPRFKWFDHRLSLLGAIACLGAMLAIDLAAGLVAVSVLAAIHQYLKRTAGAARWADSQRAYHFQRLRENLRAIASEPEHPRDWRPKLLVLSDDPPRRAKLLRFSSWLEGSSGLTTAVRILEGSGAKMHHLKEEAQAELEAHVADLRVEAYPLVVTAPNLFVGLQVLIQSHGIGPVKTNTIVLNWLDQVPEKDAASREKRYGRHLQAAVRLGCNVVVLDADEKEWQALEHLPAEARRIDVWWWDDATSRLMLLLAYLMTRSDAWHGAGIRVIAQSPDGNGSKALEALRGMLDEARIDAEPEIVPSADARTMEIRSKDAALVFAPFRIKNYMPIDPFGGHLEELFNRLPVMAMVLAAEDIPLDAEPEEGEAGALAVLLDAAEEARKKAEDAEREAVKAVEAVEKALAKLEDALENSVDPEQRSAFQDQLERAKVMAERTARKAVKARTKADDAEKAAEAVEKHPRGADPPSTISEGNGAKGNEKK